MKKEYLMTYLESERHEADERVRILQQKHDIEFMNLHAKYLAVQVLAVVNFIIIIIMCAIPDGLVSKIFNAIMKVIYE